jgi:hypothetical protein
VAETKLQYLDNRVQSLKGEYDEFVGLWREIAHWQAPHRGRFLQEKRKQGDKKYTHILNNVAGRALRDAVSGIFAGTASPSTKWFTLETNNAELMRIDSVRRYVHAVEEIVRNILRESNFYSEYPTAIGELLLFGTSGLSQVFDFESITRFYSHTIGTYYIGVNNKGQVDTFVLHKRMTPRQMLQEFPDTTPSRFKTPDMQKSRSTYEVIQLIEPNKDYDPKKLEAKFKRFSSTWFIRGEPDASGILRESGFDRFPTYVLRWSTADEYAWGVDSPGMVAQSDIRSLQQQEKNKAKAVERQIRPKLQGPTALAGAKLNDKDGDTVLYDAEHPNGGLRTIWSVDPRIQEMKEDIQRYEQAVLQAYFVDLFRAISSMQGVQPRNQLELSQRNAEALLLLGPVLERVQRELLSQVLETTFALAMENDVFPEMPTELEGGALQIRFISSLAQAQRSQDLAALGDFTQFAAGVAQVLPYVADKVDGDAILDLYTNLRGVNPLVNRGQETVQQIRQQQAQAAQQQAQLEQQNLQASANVQNASAAKMATEAGVA